MSFAYSNTTAADQYSESAKLGMVTNYAKVTDEPNMARITNKTCSLEQPELITYRSNKVSKVSTAVQVRNPGPIQDGVQYVIKLETVDRQGSAPDLVDEPIAVWLTIQHPSSNTWTNAKVAEVVKRLLSACMKDQTTTGTKTAVADAKWRFEDLQRGALVPSND